MLELEIRARAALGHFSEIRELLEARDALPTKSRHVRSQLGMYISAVQELRAHGHVSKANELAKLALKVAGYAPSSGHSLTVGDPPNLGRLLYVSEKWVEARDAFMKLALKEPLNLEYLGYLGTTAARLGDQNEALRISAELGSLNRPYLNGSNLLWCARISAVLGREAEAVGWLRLAVQNGLPFGIASDHYSSSLHNDVDFESLRQYAEFREFVRPKD